MNMAFVSDAILGSSATSVKQKLEASVRKHTHMKLYMIGYDLNTPGQDYKDLIKKIKELAHGYWHHLDSTWLIRSELSAAQIRDQLTPHVDANDEILVNGLILGDWATVGINKAGNDWLHKYNTTQVAA